MNIDEELLKEAMAVTRLRSKSAVLNEGLRRIVRGARQLQAPRDLEGTEWEGDVRQLRQNNKASVPVADYAKSRTFSLWGTVEVLEDRDSKQAAWQEGFEQYYPEGIDTPWLCVLRFTAVGGQYYQGRPHELVIDGAGNRVV